MCVIITLVLTLKYVCVINTFVFTPKRLVHVISTLVLTFKCVLLVDWYICFDKEARELECQ